MRRESLGIGHLVDHLADALIIVDTTDHVVLWNRAATTIFGYAESEAIGQPIEGFVPDYRDLQRARSVLPSADDEAIEASAVRKDGAVFVAELFVAAVPGTDSGDPFHAILVRDVTERRQREAAQQQAHRLETLGLMASGVAHDFNNQLQAILGFSELVLERLDPAQPVFPFVEEILRAGQRGAALSRHLLAFGSRQSLHPERLDLRRVVQELERTLQTLVGLRVELALTGAPSPLFIETDPTQLEQVLLNLAANARDAMADGGRLEVETRRVDVDAAAARRLQPMPAGSYALLTVRDTGHGMDERTKARIFEPFFTTKPEGKGTGLGLASVYGIVKQCRGYIWVDSEPGRGTTFSLYFPLATEEASAPDSQDEPITPSGGRPGTVLVVDDEDTVLALARAVLETSGYAVLLASQADEAVRIAERARGAIDVLVVDLLMPGASGVQVAARIRALHPAVRVLYISGYTARMVDPEAERPGTGEFLQKPFTPKALLARIEELIAGAEPRG